MNNEYDKGKAKWRYRTYLFAVFLAVIMALSCVVIFASDSEDIAADGNVAYIETGGEKTYYPTLAGAISSATTGKTVVLIADVEETVTTTIDMTIDLNGHIITGNATNNVAVITVDSGTLTIEDSGSTVSHTGTVTDHIWTSGSGDVVLHGGIITNGRGGILNNGTLVMNGGNIVGNKGYDVKMRGGGVFSTGTFTMNGGTIAYNVAERSNESELGYGGGVFSTGTFTMNGGKISDNYAKYGGGGVAIEGTATFAGGDIINNEAVQDGAGVRLNSGATATFSGVNIKGNNGPLNRGTGIFSSENNTVTISGGEIDGQTILIGGSLTISGGTIKNTTRTAIYVDGNVTMSGGIITNCDAGIAQYGGGIYLNSGTFTMTGGTISNCVASSGGAGVNVKSGATFNMSGTALITGCSTSETGAGVYVGGTMNMSGGTISNCTSNMSNGKYGTGAGIWSSGTLNVTGGTITGCTANGNNSSRAEDGGAAIYVRIGTASISGVNIYGNNVGNGCHGDAVYVRMESSAITLNKANIVGDIYFKARDAPTILAYVEEDNVITGYDDVDAAFVAAGTTGIVGTLVDITVDPLDEIDVYNMVVPEGVTVTVDGTVNYYGTVTNNGTMIVGATGTLNGDGICVNNGTITNGGAIIITGSIVDNGTITNNGTITVKVAFNANSGTGSMDAQNVPYNTATALTANAFTKEGYRFVGWNAAADGSGMAYADAQSVTLNAGLLLYAQWAMVYTIAFNANGGTGEAMANLDATAGVDIALTANVFSKDGYAFGGWAIAADGKALYSDKAVVKDLTSTAGATVTLYAVWIQIEKTDNAAVVTVTTDAVSDQAAEQLVEAAKQMKDAGTENVTVDVKATETEAVSIKSDSVKDAVDSGIGVNISTSKGAMEFSSEALAGLIEDGKTLKSEIKPIEVPPAYAEKIPADAKVFSISLTSNDVAITSFGAKFTVKVAYEASGNTDKLYVGYLAADGTIQKMESHYEDGFMVFTTDHLSDYAVLEDSSSSSGDNQGLLLAILLVAAIVLPIIAALIIFREK